MACDQAAAARRALLRQQPRAWHRRERHRAQQLRVVAQAVAAVGVGPGPVEHVFAVRVTLQIQRCCGLQLSTRFERQELRGPACLGHRAARRVQRRKVGVAHERRRRCLPVEQRVPGRGVQRLRVAVHPNNIVFISPCGCSIRLGHSRSDYVEHTP